GLLAPRLARKCTGGARKLNSARRPTIGQHAFRHIDSSDYARILESPRTWHATCSAKWRRRRRRGTAAHAGNNNKNTGSFLMTHHKAAAAALLILCGSAAHAQVG